MGPQAVLVRQLGRGRPLAALLSRVQKKASPELCLAGLAGEEKRLKKLMYPA